MNKSNENVVYETRVAEVLNKDGIRDVFIGEENGCHYPLDQYLKSMGEPPWAKRIIYNETMSAVFICQPPGTGNRAHFHKEHDEWWVVLKGEVKWWIEGVGVVNAKQGDIVFVPRGKNHKIRAVGTEVSVRLAVSPPDIPHYHPEIDPSPADF